MRRSVKLYATLIVLAAAVAYANSLTRPFMFDDESSVVRNSGLAQLSPLNAFRILKESPLAGRPVAYTSFAVNYVLGGLNPTGYHVVNVAIHFACALLIFGIVRRTLASDNLAVVIALLWTVHPLTTESVTYITERTESLMAMFLLLTLYCADRAARPELVEGRARGSTSTSRASSPFDKLRTSESRSSPRARWWTAAAIVACAAGMASKESMVPAPLIVMAYDRIFRFDSWRAAIGRRWPLYAGLFSTWALLVLDVLSTSHASSLAYSTTPWMYLLNQPILIVRYLHLALWPNALVLNYGWTRQLSLGDVLPQALIVVGLFALTAVALGRWPKFGFAGLWFFVLLAPTSSVVPIATEVGAERRMYLPLVAVIALVVIAVERLERIWSTPERFAAINKIALGAAVIALTAATIVRNREYESPLTMANTVLTRWPTPVAHAMVGNELAKLGRHDEAIAQLRLAVNGVPRSEFDLGGELFTEGRLDEAVEHLERFVTDQPRLAEVVPARLMIGQVRFQQQRWADAARQFAQAVAMAPSNLEARRALDTALTNEAVALADRGDAGEALSRFRQAVEADPRDDRARRNLATALLDSGDVDGALREAKEAARLNPSSAASREILMQASEAQQQKSARER